MTANKHGLLSKLVVQKRFHASLSHEIRLRFAPSPTGYLHLGGLRTALFNHLLARKHGGKWILRIEDTDRTRFVEGATESLVKTLRWAKFDFDEGPGKEGSCGPYVQSQRKDLYDKHVQRLVDDGKAYHCFCSAERLSTVRRQMQLAKMPSTYDRHCLHLSEAEVKRRLDEGQSSVVRFKSTTRALTQNDLVYDSIHYEKVAEEDFVIKKTDGLPTYHLANVVDDHLMGVTHVLRGEEWLPSTPKHLDLYEAFGWQPPQFAHLPLLVNQDGSKLSKRMGDVRVEDYIDKGYEPEALLNFVALMGWSPASRHSEAIDSKPSEGPEAEVLTLDELIQSFTIEGINKHRATMNLSKLNFLNRQHIARKLETETGQKELVEKTRHVLAQENIECQHEDDYIVAVLQTLQERLYTMMDLPALGSYYFQVPDYSSKGSKQLRSTVPAEEYQEILQAAIRLTEEGKDVDTLISSLLEGRKHKSVMSTLRHGATGQKVGAGVKATLETLGSTRTLTRFRAAAANSK